MSGRYHQGRVADHWRSRWEEAGVFELDPSVDDPEYILGMFPYPSGSIHMGHVRNYSITDAYARFRRMQGHDVLHPMGWDAFGLPAENAAHERGVDPESWTNDCIEQMQEQLVRLGFGYDWTRELRTCEPSYYRWNQWLFLQLYDAGLVKYEDASVNWCPDCETVLADAQVTRPEDVDEMDHRTRSPGRTLAHGQCWRCETPVTTKELPQWFFRTTELADELVDGLEGLGEWPSHIREIQRDWIGRRTGANITFRIDEEAELTVFSARPETIFGATYLAVAPSHPLVTEVELPQQSGEAWWGVDTGLTAEHPLIDTELPIWVADYVLPDVGTGAIMGVPAHNEQDFSFAQANGIPINRVITRSQGTDPELPDTGEGVLQDSGHYSGKTTEEGRELILEESGFEPATTYRLRDWLISRQRYWGTPIPMVHCDSCGRVPVPEAELPVELPPFEPTSGNPIAANEDFVQTSCPQCGAAATRETDTMDTFVDSSWYFLRFLSPEYEAGPFDSERVDAVLPVDLYVGGAEHAVLHLLYLRFISRALWHLEYLPMPEPIERLLTQGTVLHGGQKMSKSVGNVVAPHEYGEETTRVFLLSAAHPQRDFEWTAASVTHAYELQQELYDLVTGFGPETGDRDQSEPRDRGIERAIDRAIVSITDDLAQLRFHQAVREIEQLGQLLRRYQDYGSVNRYTFERGLRTVSRCLAPIAPFLAEECWNHLGGRGLVAEATWPEPYRPIEQVDRERQLIKALQNDVREIIEVASIEHPETVTVTLAAEWKYDLYDRALVSPTIDEFMNTLCSEGVLEGDRADFAESLASRHDSLEPIIPPDRERELIENAAWLLDDEFDVSVRIRGESDRDPHARPNRPGLEIE